MSGTKRSRANGIGVLSEIHEHMSYILYAVTYINTWIPKITSQSIFCATAQGYNIDISCRNWLIMFEILKLIVYEIRDRE
jgi:hypothetical protein